MSIPNHEMVELVGGPMDGMRVGVPKATRYAPATMLFEICHEGVRHGYTRHIEITGSLKNLIDAKATFIHTHDGLPVFRHTGVIKKP